MKEREDVPLVKFLEKLKDDRAAMARLRRGVGKRGGAPEMCRYVAPFLPNAPDAPTERYFLIAALFALHPESAGRGSSMGKVFRAMMASSPSVEKRFEQLLAVDSKDLAGHLLLAVKLAKSKSAWVDFHQLYHDIKEWNYSDHRVQMRWAREFWGYEKEANKQTTETESKGETL